MTASDDYTILNPGSDGDVMDETGVTFPSSPTIRKRPRIVLTGEGKDSIVQAQNTDPTGQEYGLVTRPVISPYPGTSIQAFHQVTNISQNTATTITSYTVPNNKTFYFLGALSSGNTTAKYSVAVDGTTGIAGRTTSANLNWELLNNTALFQVAEGQTVTLSVIHQTNAFCDFEATILGYVL